MNPLNQRISLEDRIAGGLWGLLIGDAVGVPYEFHRPLHLPPRHQLDMHPPPGFRRAHATVAPGTWSDDGAQALCLLVSLLDRGELDVSDFAVRLLRWYEHGYMAVDGVVFDVGVQTGRALSALRAGTPAEKAGPNGDRDNGNGALMRVLPLALWHRGTDEDLVRDAHRQSLPTHGHPRSQVCCAFYCMWARGVLRGSDDAADRALEVLREIYAPDAVCARELEVVFPPGAEWIPGGGGYVVDCLRSALHATRESTYEGVIQAAIALGHDTDTTACVAGGIAGIRHGVSGIPERWRTAMRGGAIVEPLLTGLLDHIASDQPTATNRPNPRWKVRRTWRSPPRCG